MAVTTRNAAIGALLLLGGMAIGFLVAAPYLQGSSNFQGQEASDPASTAHSGGTLQQARRVTMLEKEIERLKEAIAQEEAGSGGAGVASSTGSSTAAAVHMYPPNKETTVHIDMMGFLGLQSYFAGVSWDPFYCAVPYTVPWQDADNATLDAVEDRLVAELRAELAKIKGVKVEDIDPGVQYHAQGIKAIEGMNPNKLSIYATDPHFATWRRRMVMVLSRYMARGDRAMALHDACDKIKGKVFKIEDMGTPQVDCTDVLSENQILEAVGYYALPHFSIREIASGLIRVGHCFGQVRDHQPSYAHWLRNERMFNPEWMTFPVDTPEQDAVVLLFDVLYEKMAVFTRQYWLGVITMQNPFDMYSIQDIIFQTRPDLIIETGTANGGSALLWASILHLAEMNHSRIVTVDMNVPKWEGAGWGGKAREDPTKHPLWNEHVTFIQGSSVDPATVDKIKAMAAGKKVMVLLDSHHSSLHVSEEMEHYCPLVSRDCYCIIEDTKMSRWASDGPLESVRQFMAGKHGKEFTVDRSRELLYSHHTMGYLRRLKVGRSS